MLEEVLSREDCARCEFCCSFRRQSLDLTPCFAVERMDEVRRLYPEARFKTRDNGAITIDIDDNYSTNDSREEALCYFNRNGCILPEHLKPFECKIWPFRLMRKDDSLWLVLVPTCPWIKTDDASRLRSAALSMAKEAVEYSKDHPEIIIGYRDDYQIIINASEGDDMVLKADG